MIKSKKNTYKFWHSPIALIVLLFILILFGYKMIYLIKKERETAHTKAEILDHLSTLKKKEATLIKDMSRIETVGGKEEIIREKYPMVQTGEKMVTIVDEEKNGNTVPVEGNTNHGFWNWLKGILGMN